MGNPDDHQCLWSKCKQPLIANADGSYPAFCSEHRKEMEAKAGQKKVTGSMGGRKIKVKLRGGQVNI